MASGLLDSTSQMAETRMVPMFLSVGLYSVNSGESPVLFGGTSGPKKVDILPVMLCNGGSDAHVEKSIPSISGFWPAEAGKLDEWPYYYYGYSNSGWKHLQQEFTWLQPPTPVVRRVFLEFGEEENGIERIDVNLLDAEFSEGRGFELGLRA